MKTAVEIMRFRAVINVLARNLFDTDRTETTGDYLHFKLFEVLVVGQTLWMCWNWAPYIDRLSTVVLPLGIAHYLDITFMFQSPAAWINAALITLFCIWGWAGRLPFNRFAYLSALLLFHLQYVARYSQGSIAHGHNYTGMALLALGISAVVFHTNARHRRKAAFGITLFFVGLGYSSAAVTKLAASGFGWVDGPHLWMWIGERATDMLSQHGHAQMNVLQEWILQNKSAATAILTFGLITESLGFALWFRRSRPWIATMILAMHLGITLTMDITFIYFIFIIGVIGYPWGRWLERFFD